MDTPLSPSSVSSNSTKKAISRAREILDSMKERRDVLSEAIQTTKDHHCRRSLEQQKVSQHAADLLKKRRTNPFSGEGGSEAIAKEIAKSLHERRERLSRILAGLDPDTGEEKGMADVASIPRDQQQQEYSIAKATTLDGSTESKSSLSSSSSSRSSSSTEILKIPPMPHLSTDTAKSAFKRVEGGVVLSHSPMPPTLEEIQAAFESPTNTTEESSSESSSLVAEDGDRVDNDDDGRGSVCSRRLSSLEAETRKSPQKLGHDEAGDRGRICYTPESQLFTPPDKSKISRHGVSPSLGHRVSGVRRRASSFDESLLSSNGPSVMRRTCSFDSRLKQISSGSSAGSEGGLECPRLSFRDATQTPIDTKSNFQSAIADSPSSLHSPSSSQLPPRYDTPVEDKQSQNESSNFEDSPSSLQSQGSSQFETMPSCCDMPAQEKKCPFRTESCEDSPSSLHSPSSSQLEAMVKSLSRSSRRGVRLVYSFDDSSNGVKTTPWINRSFSFGMSPLVETPHRLTIEDLKLPVRLSPSVSWQSCRRKTCSDRPISPESTTSTLTTGEEERPGYLGNLYSTRAKLDENAPRKSGEDGLASSDMIYGRIGKVSSARDPNKSPLTSPLTLSLSEDPSLLMSDDSSLDLTYDSTSSGWISATDGEGGGDDDDDSTFASLLLPPAPEDCAGSVDSESELRAPFMKPRYHNNETTKPTIIGSLLRAPSFGRRQFKTTTKGLEAKTMKRVAFANMEELAPSSEQQQQSQSSTTRTKKQLFVPEPIADAMSQSNCSMYAIATRSGLDLADADKPSMDGIRQMMNLAKSSKNQSKFRLCSDFRCGAQGSMYNIALRSKFDLKTPWQWRNKGKKFQTARGGLLDLASRSGLTKGRLHSRESYTVQAKPISHCREDYADVLPEDVTDYECGATNSLFVAFETGGGDYVSKGSLYYLASRSGMALKR